MYIETFEFNALNKLNLVQLQLHQQINQLGGYCKRANYALENKYSNKNLPYVPPATVGMLSAHISIIQAHSFKLQQCLQELLMINNTQKKDHWLSRLINSMSSSKPQQKVYAEDIELTDDAVKIQALSIEFYLLMKIVKQYTQTITTSEDFDQEIIIDAYNTLLTDLDSLNLKTENKSTFNYLNAVFELEERIRAQEELSFCATYDVLTEVLKTLILYKSDIVYFSPEDKKNDVVTLIEIIPNLQNSLKYFSDEFGLDTNAQFTKNSCSAYQILQRIYMLIDSLMTDLKKPIKHNISGSATYHINHLNSLFKKNKMPNLTPKLK